MQRLIITTNNTPDNASIAPVIMLAETKKTGSSKGDSPTDTLCCDVNWRTRDVVAVEVVDIDICAFMLEVGPLAIPVSVKVTIAGSEVIVELTCAMVLVVAEVTVTGTELKQFYISCISN